MRKYTGIKKVAGETKTLNRYAPEHLEIAYDPETDKVWSVYFYGVNQSWSEYHDKNIITVNFGEPATMAEIKAAIEAAEMMSSVEW